MANELLYGSGSAANLFDAARTEALFEETIGDKDYSILAHPALMYFGDKAGGISAVSNIPVVDLSDDEFASLTEIEELTPSDITSAVATITVARRGLERDLGDFAAALDGTGALDEIALADGMIVGANLTSLNLLVTMGITATTVAGASGATMTHATIRSAKQSLRSASVQGPYICILGQKQYNEWETDFEALGGAIQMKTDQAREMARLTGSSYQGTWDNIDFFTTSKVVTDGTDLNGCMFGRGFAGWQSLRTKPALGRLTLMDAGWVVVEVDRQGKKALSGLVGNMYIGWGKIQDSGGVRLRSVD
jgi:hypothetical protein